MYLIKTLMGDITKVTDVQATLQELYQICWLPMYGCV